ncbi:hypothetical protein I5677_10855 [Mobilitalea sibirica]|uniref:Uncharacterized protein n=1 Tax=Mobilitalea sibirica TaxID=1462919 RepID=A0A8J7KTH5_9FIRM|nr:hypothetical protein [Mobilitalea sibirica]MBH1941391.1 hypothetical protein [Mobilitalea sibirica]
MKASILLSLESSERAEKKALVTKEEANETAIHEKEFRVDLYLFKDIP